MKIPFLNLARASAELGAETVDAITRAINRGNFILGEEVEVFEREWARYQTAEMSAVREIARRRNLFVVEDAAQAHGALCGGKPRGFQSFAATFSFYPTKNLGAFGDGGAIVSDDEEFLRRVRLLRQGGHLEALQSNLTGRNSRLDEIQAAVLRVKLKKLDEWNERRRALAAIYFERLREFPRLRLPFVRNYDEHVFHLFVVRSARGATA